MHKLIYNFFPKSKTVVITSSFILSQVNGGLVVFMKANCHTMNLSFLSVAEFHKNE